MKTRKHHNNKGTRQIKRGKCEQHIRRLAKRLGVPYGTPKAHQP
jgi:hypothetical protein